MHTEAGDPQATSGSRLERAVVLALLDDEGEPRQTLVSLQQELDAAAGELQAALQALQAAGVLCFADGLAWAAPATRRLGELELIAV